MRPSKNPNGQRARHETHCDGACLDAPPAGQCLEAAAPGALPVGGRERSVSHLVLLDYTQECFVHSLLMHLGAIHYTARFDIGLASPKEG